MITKFLAKLRSYNNRASNTARLPIAGEAATKQTEQSQLNTEPEVEHSEVVDPELEAAGPTIDPFGLGLTDAAMGGWFNQETGCLISDFNIEAEDIVLDVGCGDGGQASFCGRRGAHVILADINEKLVAEARELLLRTAARKVEGIVSDSTPIPLPNETATRIICSEVLEHVEDPDAVLKELVRVGKPGARYLLSVPDAEAERLQQGIAPESYFQKPNHIRIIEPLDFEQMVNSAGLIVEQRIPRSFYWNLWWLFLWVCDQDASPPWHPLLENWTKTWEALLCMEGGLKVKAALDNALPKSQLIIAKKP